MIEMKKLGLFALAALLLALALAACGGGAASTQPEPTQGVSTTSATTSGTQPTATKAVQAAQATPAPAVEGTPTQAEEQDLSLSSVTGGLESAKSYKSKLDMTFTGKDAQGQDVTNTWSMAEAFILDPRAQDVAWTSSESTGGQPATVTSGEMINIGQDAYWISTDAAGTQSCMAISSADATPPEQALSADMWGSVSDARYVNTETVNGVSAKHYVWKEGAFAGFGYTSGKGETWVAVDGGYVVRQKVEATGKGLALAGSDAEGTMNWEWNVSDVNGSFEILPPEGCESAAQGIPVMADATDKSTIGDLITYTSPSAFADVVDFYKAEMPKAGWQASGTPTEMEGFSMLEFTKEGQTATVSISYDESSQKTTVMVNVTK
jgi:hypothetical protein